MIKKCLKCGKKFKTFPSRVGKYCSYKCSTSSTLNGWKKGDLIIVPPSARKRQGKKMKQYCGKKCWNWREFDLVSIRAKHRKIEIIKGSAKKYKCKCGKQAKEYANINHLYSSNPDEYIPMCHSCHTKYDIKMGFRKNPTWAKSK